MNTPKHLLLFLISLCLLSSCNIEPFEGEINTENTNPDNTNNTGNYWPMTIGNSWTYSQSVSGFSDTESTMEISSIEDYLGAPSYKYINFLGNVQGTDGTSFSEVSLDSYTRNTNGDYRIFVGEMTAEFSGLFKVKQSAYDYVILKDYEDAGYKWDYDFDVVTSYEALISTGGAQLPNVITNYKVSLEILEKGASVEVDGNTYSDVIKVEFIQEVSFNDPTLGSSTSKANYIYYFAKDIGIVKIEGTILDGDSNISSEITQILKGYTIN